MPFFKPKVTRAQPSNNSTLALVSSTASSRASPSEAASMHSHMSASVLEGNALSSRVRKKEVASASESDVGALGPGEEEASASMLEQALALESGPGALGYRYEQRHRNESFNATESPEEVALTLYSADEAQLAQKVKDVNNALEAIKTIPRYAGGAGGSPEDIRDLQRYLSTNLQQFISNVLGYTGNEDTKMVIMGIWNTMIDSIQRSNLSHDKIRHISTEILTPIRKVFVAEAPTEEPLALVPGKRAYGGSKGIRKTKKKATTVKSKPTRKYKKRSTSSFKKTVTRKY